MEIFGFSRDMSGHVAHMAGQMQDQSQNQMNQILAQADTQRMEAKQREEAQRAKQREEA